MLAGSLDVVDDHHVLGPGPVASAALSWLTRPEAGVVPFVLLGASLGASTLRSRLGEQAPARLSAFDLRVSATAGWTFFERLTPYATARLFGGPILWRLGGEGAIGTDTNHVALGAGLSARLPLGLSLFGEALPLGEQALSVGAGLEL